MEINKTVIVASRWFLYYLTYIDDVRSNINQVQNMPSETRALKSVLRKKTKSQVNVKVKVTLERP